MLALIATLCICVAEEGFRDSKRNVGFGPSSTDAVGGTEVSLREPCTSKFIEPQGLRSAVDALPFTEK